MRKEWKRITVQIILFILTFITTTLAGTEWTHGKSVLFSEPYTWSDFASGLLFSIPFLLILTVHEFGHYFTARYHRIKASLPYYIPIPPVIPLSIGTFGALIRLRERVPSLRQNFDIGIAGPLAGFVVALAVLFYGFANLPPAEYIYTIHPEYEQYGLNYADHVYANDSIVNVSLGKNLLFMFFEKYVADPQRVPNMNEMMHYPYLFAGFLALVFTSLNLLPIGQLDGGHILYGLVGFKKHRIIASVVFVAFIFYAGLGLEGIRPSQPSSVLMLSIPLYAMFLYLCFTGLRLPVKDTIMYAVLVFAAQYLVMFLFPTVTGYAGWLLFGLLIGRVVGIPHPPVQTEEPLDQKRIILGWLALIILILCFTPAPINIY